MSIISRNIHSHWFPIKSMSSVYVLLRSSVRLSRDTKKHRLSEDLNVLLYLCCANLLILIEIKTCFFYITYINNAFPCWGRQKLLQHILICFFYSLEQLFSYTCSPANCEINFLNLYYFLNQIQFVSHHEF